MNASIPSRTASFATSLVGWQKQHGRHGLPWHSKDPYRVWVSELMLQQTQVSTVLKYYTPFLEAFPSVEVLAKATQDEVYAKWSGLGYYRRARFLHEGAKKVVSEFGGAFPKTVALLLTLPGVGQSTAHAIASFCFHERVSILDGNVQRTLSRWSGFQEAVDSGSGQKKLWALATQLVPTRPEDMPTYTQALMDMGATVCTPKKPTCSVCPVNTTCEAFRQHIVAQIPVKKQKKAIPTKHMSASWHSRTHADGVVEIGFIQYDDSLGIWEHLYGPPLAFVEAAPSTADFQLTHVFSHFKGVFHVSQISLDTEQPPALIWKTPAQWHGYGLSSPVKIFLDKLTQKP